MRLPTRHAVRSGHIAGLAAALLALTVACASDTTTPAPTATSPPAPTIAPTPTPISTLVPTATSTAAPVAVETPALDLAASEAFAALEEFLEVLGPRESATGQESAAAPYLQARFQ